MTLPPPRGSYKALLLDYDWLMTLSDEECCYSLSEREIQILLAQIDMTGWKTRYEPTETEIDTDVISAWAGNLARKLMSGCCPDDGTIGRFGDDGQWETSDDGGVTWENHPELDPRDDYIGSPPLPGVSSSAKRCAAADNVRALFVEYRDNIIQLLTDASGLIAIVAGILAFLAVITGISGAAIGISVLLMGLATALLSETPASVAAQIDDIALDTFRCLVYCRMNNDGELTYGEWVGLLADIAAEFTGFPETFFYQTVNGMGYIGVTNAATLGAATAADCGDCNCGTCAEKYQIYLGNPAYGSIVEYGADFITVDTGPTGYITIEAIDFNDCCYVNSMEVLIGAGSGTAFENCGAEPSPPWIAGTAVGQCASIIECQFVTTGRMKIFLGTCP